MRYAVPFAIAALFAWLGVESSRGADGDQLFKLTADDATAQDLFGGATPHDTDDRTTQGVAVDGELAIIGAPGADMDAGAVYAFDLTSGQQRQKLTAVGGEPGDTFGSAVAILGETALVGAAHNTSGSTTPGSAYVLDLATGSQLLTLVPDDPLAQFDGFGWSVDLGRDVALVGAPLHPAADEPVGGSVYVFDVATGQQLQKLVPDQPRSADDWFGISVDMSGSTAIVGAWGDNNFAGAAYLFDVATGQQLHKLTSPEADPFDEFGHSVSIQGNVAVVGAPSDENDDGEFSGAAHVFNVATGEFLRTLSPSDAQTEHRFGWSVGLEGSTAIVGAPGDSDNGFFAGSAYLFDVTTGQQLRKLISDDVTDQDNLGWSVAMDNGRALVAAPFDDGACGGTEDCRSGATYVFAVPPPELLAGDANQDFTFDQRDIVQVSQAAKYLTDQPATWGDGDWNGAPGGSQNDPPDGDGRFDQLDIVASLAEGIYLTGPYAATDRQDQSGNEQASLVYDAGSGEFSIAVPDGVRLTSINIDSVTGIFTGDAAHHLGGSFDNDTDGNIFKATFGSSFGELSFGSVAPSGLSEPFLRADLTVVGSWERGGTLGEVGLVYIPVPEPSAVWLLMIGGAWVAARRRTAHGRMTND